MTLSGIRAALMGVALLCASPVLAAQTPGQSFLKDAIEDNLSAIAVGKLAVEKGVSGAVKAYGQTLIDDGNKANAAATDAAKSLAVALPTAANAEQVALHDHLAKEPAASFDTDFVNAMLQASVKTVTSYETAAKDDKDAAGTYASAILPAMQQHLSAIQTIAKAMRI